MNKKIHTLLLTSIFLLAFFLRFYKLGQIPYGFYQDESAIGYNAYSIMQTGRDEYGKFLPLYFKSFGDWKLPVYIYTTVASIKVFGLNEFAVRFPSALFGSLTVVIFYLFVKELFEINPKSRGGLSNPPSRWKPIDTSVLPLISTMLLAVSPWHLHYSRATFEVSTSLFLFVLGGLLLLKSFRKKTFGLFVSGTICFVIALYSYNLTRLLSPLLFLLFILLNLEKLKSLSKSELLVTTLVSIILLSPFFRTLFIAGGVGSAGGTVIWSSAAVQAPLLEFRSYLIGLPDIFEKVFFNMTALTVWQYIKNVFSYLSVDFFFLGGSPHGNHGIGNVGQFYLFELLLIVLGVVALFRNKAERRNLLLGWTIIVILVASLTREVPHATRSFFLIAPIEVFSAMGLLSFWSWAKSIKNSQYRVGTVLMVGILILYNIIYYLTSYYVRFPIAYAKAWRSEDKALSLFIRENQEKYDKIIFDKEAGFIYTSLIFYLKYPPSEFQTTSVRVPDDSEGMSEIRSFGKFEFREIDWSKDLNYRNTLIITTPDRKPKDLPVIKAFYYPKRPVVIAQKQEIIQYPVDEVAYVLVESP